MMDWIDWPLRQMQAMDGLPGWLRQSLPMDWLILKCAIVALLTFVFAGLVKRLVRFIGKRRMAARERSYDGSVWDMANSVIRFLILLLGALLIASMLGVDVQSFVERHGGGVTQAIAILVGAILMAGWLGRSIRKFGDKARLSHHADGTLFAFMAALVSYLVIGMAIILALTQLGVQTASLIALVGAAGLAIALALQDTLKAVASGVMLAIFRPYRIGDWVHIAGMEGEVTDINPFRTTIKPVTNQAVSLPNDKVWTDSISNSSRFARRRLDLYFDIAYEDDLDQALTVTREAINDLSRVLAKPETWVGVHAFRDSSVQVRARVWVATPDYVQMRSECLKAVKAAYDRTGITIPYPHQVEMLRQEKPERGGSGTDAD